MVEIPTLFLGLNDQLIQIGLVILVLAIIWIALRFILRLATRIFTAGCVMIVIIGLLYLLLRQFT
jgi:hypothetical protein